MKFVKSSHGDNSDLQVSEIKRSSFDPRLLEHCLKINADHLQALSTDVQKYVYANTGPLAALVRLSKP